MQVKTYFSVRGELIIMETFLINERGHVCHTKEFDVTEDHSPEAILKNKEASVCEHQSDVDRANEVRKTVLSLEDIVRELNDKHGEVSDIEVNMPPKGQTDPEKAVKYG